MGRKAKSKKITPKREKLSTAVALSKSPSTSQNAQLVLGYHNAEVTDDIASPEVARAVKAKLVRRMVTEGAPLALSLLIKMAKAGRKAIDADQHPTVGQLDAAKSLLQYAGLQAASEELRIHKDPGEMNGAELEEAMKRLADAQRQLGAVDVDGTVSAPSDAPVQGQAVENVDDLFS